MKFNKNFVVVREGDGPLVTVNDGTVCDVNIEGYAIIPMEVYQQLLTGWNILDNPESFPCNLCGAKEPTEEGHDPCIANLPGVEYACCGHGKGTGYVKFTDGRTMNGFFSVKDRQS